MSADDKTQEHHSVTLAELKRVRSQGFVSVYTNNVNATAMFFDLSLIFGQIVVVPQGETFLEDRVSVTMAWEQVGPLRDLLDRLLKNYEKNHTVRKVQADQ